MLKVQCALRLMRTLSTNQQYLNNQPNSDLAFYGRLLTAQRSLSEVHVMFCECYFIFLWPPYAPAQVNRGSQNFYTWWTLSVNREVTTWIFSWSSLNYRIGQKVMKFGIFSDPTRKLSALTPEHGRIL